MNSCVYDQCHRDAFNAAATADPALMRAIRNQVYLLLEAGASFQEALAAIDKVVADYHPRRRQPLKRVLKSPRGF